jgi:hypothetical protein
MGQSAHIWLVHIQIRKPRTCIASCECLRKAKVESTLNSYFSCDGNSVMLLYGRVWVAFSSGDVIYVHNTVRKVPSKASAKANKVCFICIIIYLLLVGLIPLPFAYIARPDRSLCHTYTASQSRRMLPFGLKVIWFIFSLSGEFSCLMLSLLYQ